MNESTRSMQFQLCFHPLADNSHAFSFPCDAEGHVDLDGMSERARNNYFYARAMMGRELSAPVVEMLH